MLLTGKVYDVTKAVALVWLPAVGAFYFVLAGIWGLPNAEQVNGSILAVDTLLGALLGISTAAYNKSDAKFDGSVLLEPHPDGGSQLRLQSVDEDALVSKDQVLLKVNQTATPAPPALAMDDRLLGD